MEKFRLQCGCGWGLGSNLSSQFASKLESWLGVEGAGTSAVGHLRRAATLGYQSARPTPYAHLPVL